MFSITADIDAAERLLTDIGRKQLPFATAMAINDTAMAVKDDEEIELGRALDRPTPFTKRAFYVRRASKSRLMARVGVKDQQAKYLGFQVKGGTRRPKGRALVVGVQARRNAYGNMPKAAVKRLIAKDNVFVAGARRSKTKHLPAGVYQRPRGKRKSMGLKLMVSFEPRAQYTKRFAFDRVAQRKARQVFEPRFFERLRRAIETAR